MTAKQRVPAAPGWIRLDESDPRLLGTKCRSCGSVFFPRQTLACRNPACDGRELDEVPLSRRGRVWSWTTNHYAPPPPYVAPDPFVPYTVAAVELAEERMVVLGQLAAGVDPASLEIGGEMELVLETLFEDAEREHVVWKWRPVA
jgi:uncharacterized OB-fold protein